MRLTQEDNSIIKISMFASLNKNFCKFCFVWFLIGGEGEEDKLCVLFCLITLIKWVFMSYNSDVIQPPSLHREGQVSDVQNNLQPFVIPIIFTSCQRYENLEEDNSYIVLCPIPLHLRSLKLYTKEVLSFPQSIAKLFIFVTRIDILILGCCIRFTCTLIK